MTTIEFLNFGAMLAIWLILIRAGQILFADTWIAAPLGVLVPSP